MKSYHTANQLRRLLQLGEVEAFELEKALRTLSFPLLNKLNERLEALEWVGDITRSKAKRCERGQCDAAKALGAANAIKRRR